MSKVYKCQFCSYRGTKEKLISHVDKKHPEMIPEGFTAGRTVFNYINHKDHGVCVVCKRPTEWNEERLKYNRLCGREECKKALREKYSKNMIKVYGTDNLLTDMEQQEKMLKNRRISGKYRFSDGGYCTYTGQYELKALEFLDKVLGYTSNEILTPGPIVEYEYKGKKLKWILDILIIPYNLVIDVKDGGDNPNNREMKSYREKQVAKESSIQKLGEFNYLRLTNNNFEQLIQILAELKMQMVDSSYEDGRTIVRVHEDYIEEASGIKKKTSYEGMLTNQDELTWRKKIKILYLDKEKIMQLGYPEEYANKPQPCIFIKGKKYRARAEMLLINDNGEVLIQEGKERAFPYTVCGGGIDDPTEDSKYAAIRECEEEALIVPKDVEFTGIIWFMKYHTKIKANDGAVVFLYIGKYDKPYKGYVKKIDRDSFATKAKWIKIKDAKLGEPHQLAINQYLNL